MAAVFHYELVFIHPLSHGNGRMARPDCGTLRF
ncbi:MAG: Fic family protein [Eubacteriaceae bacterium]|nr:Fic family protein [Eubacteriaceae bacterium]